MSETFDLMAFIEGSSYPQKTVTLYTDVAAMQHVDDVVGKIAASTADDNLTELEDELAAAKLEVEKSALNFELLGMPFMIAREIADIFAESEEDKATEDQLFELIEKSIQKVTNASGATTSLPNVEGLKQIRKLVSPLEFQKLINGTVEVCFAAAEYEADIDAGFPGGSSDVE